MTLSPLWLLASGHRFNVWIRDWKMTARARMLLAFTWGVVCCSTILNLAEIGDRTASVLVFVAVANGFYQVWVFSPKRRREENDAAFAARIAREHGINAEYRADEPTFHRTYIVDPATYRAIAEHAFLSHGSSASKVSE